MVNQVADSMFAELFEELSLTSSKARQLLARASVGETGANSGPDWALDVFALADQTLAQIQVGHWQMDDVCEYLLRTMALVAQRLVLNPEGRYISAEVSAAIEYLQDYFVNRLPIVINDLFNQANYSGRIVQIDWSWEMITSGFDWAAYPPQS